MSIDVKKLTLSAKALREVRRAGHEARPEFMNGRTANVVGMGVGVKWRGGEPTGDPASAPITERADDAPAYLCQRMVWVDAGTPDPLAGPACRQARLARRRAVSPVGPGRRVAPAEAAPVTSGTRGDARGTRPTSGSRHLGSIVA